MPCRTGDVRDRRRMSGETGRGGRGRARGRGGGRGDGDGGQRPLSRFCGDRHGGSRKERGFRGRWEGGGTWREDRRNIAYKGSPLLALLTRSLGGGARRLVPLARYCVFHASLVPPYPHRSVLETLRPSLPPPPRRRRSHTRSNEHSPWASRGRGEPQLLTEIIDGAPVKFCIASVSSPDDVNACRQAAGLINLLLSFATSYNLVRHRLPRCRTRPPASSMHAAATPSISGNVGCTLLRTSSVHALFSHTLVRAPQVLSTPDLLQLVSDICGSRWIHRIPLTPTPGPNTTHDTRIDRPPVLRLMHSACSPRNRVHVQCLHAWSRLFRAPWPRPL